jgi:8-oxo-dGTP diphosphatase
MGQGSTGGEHDPEVLLTSEGLRQWSVAGGVVVRGDHCLLVQNRRRNGDVDWSTPGGVIDAGETMVGGLGREVTEETGLEITDWHGPLYRVEVTAPGFGFFLQAEAHRALSFQGDLTVDDPDGIVIGAEFVSVELVQARLEGAPRWVAEPLLAHLLEGVDDGRLFSYHLEGTSSVDRRVIRLSS